MPRNGDSLVLRRAFYHGREAAERLRGACAAIRGLKGAGRIITMAGPGQLLSTTSSSGQRLRSEGAITVSSQGMSMP